MNRRTRVRLITWTQAAELGMWSGELLTGRYCEVDRRRLRRALRVCVRKLRALNLLVQMIVTRLQRKVV